MIELSVIAIAIVILAIVFGVLASVDDVPYDPYEHFDGREH